MKKWEYQEVIANYSEGENLLTVCKREGQKGWELVAIIRDNPHLSPFLFFKREIPEPPIDKQIDQLTGELVDDCKKQEIPLSISRENNPMPHMFEGLLE